MAKNCIGLDIGSSAIKVVQVKQSKRGVQLVNFGIEPVPTQSIVDGSIMNSGAIADAISSLFQKLRIRQKEVSLAISGHSVIFLMSSSRFSSIAFSSYSTLCTKPPVSLAAIRLT